MAKLTPAQRKQIGEQGRIATLHCARSYQPTAK
jgi:hypothetical protein